MKHLSHILILSWVSVLSTGCIEQGSEPNNTPIEDEYRGVGCEEDLSLCTGNEYCTLVDPCGSSCDGENSDISCPSMCVEVYACVEPLNEGERCEVELDHCSSGLSCLEDQDAGCEPSFCEDGMCTQDCVSVYTCQATPIELCDPEAEDNSCTDGQVCGIASFESVECTPNGGCPNVLPNPIFGCVPELVEGQECDILYLDYGYDQCGEGLICAYGPNECINCDDDDGNCMASCSTPLPSCQPQPDITEDI